MSQRIVIHNFGPIKDLDMPIKDLTLLIGPNASGKSLVGKLVYYFQTLWRKLAEKTYFDCVEAFEFSWANHGKIWGQISTSEQTLLRESIAYFYEVCGNHRDKEHIKGSIEFYYANDQFIRLEIDHHINLVLSDDIIKIDESSRLLLSNFVSGLLTQLNFEVAPKLREYPHQFPQDGKQKVRLELYNFIETKFADFFQIPQRRSSIFVPPGRNQLLRFDVKKLYGKISPETKIFDHLSNEFIRLIEDSIKPSLKGGSLDYIPAQQEKFNRFKSDYWKRFFAQMNTVIGANMSIDVFNNEIQLTTKRGRIPINLASAGQQEATGIFLILIWLMNQFEKNKDTSSLILEEPEAHLFPEIQQNLVNALALFLNVCKGSQLFINTHSPYILSAIDNLVQAASVARERPELANEVDKIVSKEFWIDYDKIGAYHLDETGITDIRDEEWRSLGPNKIDDSSAGIATVFEQLLDLKYAKT